MAALDPPAGCRFLDMGAGRGALTGPALDRGCLVTTVDAAPAMCKRLAADYPAAVVNVMDAQDLDFSRLPGHLPSPPDRPQPVRAMRRHAALGWRCGRGGAAAARPTTGRGGR